MGMIDTSQFRKGLKIEIDDAPWEIVDFQHVKPGKGSAFVRTRIKNLLTANTIDKTFRSGDTVGEADCEEIQCDYLYNDGEHWFFMNNATFEQFEVLETAAGDASIDYSGASKGASGSTNATANAAARAGSSQPAGGRSGRGGVGSSLVWMKDQ